MGAQQRLHPRPAKLWTHVDLAASRASLRPWFPRRHLPVLLRHCSRTTHCAIRLTSVTTPYSTSALPMIEEGKTEGWLRLPINTLQPWATFNNVSLNGIKVGPQPGHEDRGSTVIACQELHATDAAPLMIVPRDLVLSLERVQEHAKTDKDFRAVLEALGEFGRVGVSRSVSRPFLFSVQHSPRPTFRSRVELFCHTTSRALEVSYEMIRPAVPLFYDTLGRVEVYAPSPFQLPSSSSCSNIMYLPASITRIICIMSHV